MLNVIVKSANSFVPSPNSRDFKQVLKVKPEHHTKGHQVGYLGQKTEKQTIKQVQG